MEAGINEIKLNGTIMELLYGRALVEINDAGNPPLAAPEVRFLGNNDKNITILVNDPGTTFMQEGHLAFLTKILAACKLNMGDVAIVNTAHTTNIANVMGTLKPSKIFAFGIDVTINGTDHIKAPAIVELVPETEEAKAKKSKLWADLKRLLSL